MLQIAKLVGLFFSLSAFAAPQFDASLLASFERRTDADFPQELLGFEPRVRAVFGDTASISLRAGFQQPLQPYLTGRIAFVECMGLWTPRPGLWVPGLFVQVAGPELQDWRREGMQLRNAGGAYLRWQPKQWFWAAAAAGPYWTASTYSHTASGEAVSEAGLLQQLTLTLQLQTLRVEVLAEAVQDYNGQWANAFFTQERISIALTHFFSVGVSHQLNVASRDLATGQTRSIAFFDGRDSRFAGFMQWRI